MNGFIRARLIVSQGIRPFWGGEVDRASQGKYDLEPLYFLIEEEAKLGTYRSGLENRQSINKGAINL